MQRITDKDLLAVVDRINHLTNSSPVSYIETDGELRACIGNYHLSYAYGGVNLHRMHSSGGGITTPIGCGHTTKRDLYNRMQAYIAGLCDSKKN